MSQQEVIYLEYGINNSNGYELDYRFKWNEPELERIKDVLPIEDMVFTLDNAEITKCKRIQTNELTPRYNFEHVADVRLEEYTEQPEKTIYEKYD